ncbi:hypothetical protein [Blastomonas sp. AAP53]|uniref:hypothetical protein n=1 Tax=Blastomonas sp. AAP53 TaxID=1248760 RepID=UPI0002F5C1FA|nr:hypothetical protein [Blastomonas sp. AAP53]
MTGLAASIAAAALLFASSQGDGSEPRGPAPTGAWTDMYGDAQHPGASYRVRLFVHAAQACLHFAGEEAYDAQRAAFLNAMMDETCAGLEQRYRAILADPATDALSRALVERHWEPLRD